jgi:hypothetical protein
MAAIRETQMFSVPLLHLLLIRGLEKDTADAEDSALLAHGVFLLCVCSGQCPVPGKINAYWPKLALSLHLAAQLDAIDCSAEVEPYAARPFRSRITPVGCSTSTIAALAPKDKES